MKPTAASIQKCALLLLALFLTLTAIMASFSFLYALRLPGKTQYTSSLGKPSSAQLAHRAFREEPPAGPVLEEMATETGQPMAVSRKFNILLIGKDMQEGKSAPRSDSMILCTFDKAKNTLTLTSILRDLYVPIPGYRSNRINAAYAYGGSSLLKQTLEKNFDIPIQGMIEVDFSQFANIIDLLGGVTMPLRQDEADYINSVCGSNLISGTQLLSGSQALAYARIRKLDSNGDFSRTNRQRRLLTALVASYKTAGFSELLAVLEAVFPMVSTDLSLMQILELVWLVAPSLSEVKLTTQCVPAEGTYVYKTIRGMSVLVADMDAAKALLQRTTKEDSR